MTDCCDGTWVALSLAILSSSLSAFVILASALAFVKYKFVEPSVISSELSLVAICASTYVLIAFALANVSSELDTELMSVSSTPEARSATSKLDMLLPVPLASIVLFVSVNVSLAMLASCASTYALTDCCDGT